MRRSWLRSFWNDGCRATRPVIWLFAVLLACAMIVQPVNAGIAPVGRAASSDGADGSAPLVWAAEPAEGPSLFSPARGSAVVYIPPASDAQPAALVITPAKSVDASTPSGEVER